MKNVKKKAPRSGTKDPAGKQQKIDKLELPIMPKDKPKSYGKEKLHRSNKDVEAELKGEEQAHREFSPDELAGQSKRIRTPQEERESKELNEDKIEEDPLH